MPNQQNIVLIITDQWRGDCLSVAGHPVVHTPFLDQLALRGARFRRAYTATPSCIASRASLMTGLKPRTHGRVGYQDGVTWNYPVTLAGEFTRHGYQTQAVGKMHVYPERSQMGFQNVILHDGFMHYARRDRKNLDLVDDYLPWLREQTGRNVDYFEHGVNCNSVVARPWDKEEYLHPTNYVTAQAIDFLRCRDTRKPFFLFISYHRPHPPYDPPAWAFEQYVNREMSPPPVGDWVEVFAPHANAHDPTSFAGQIDPHVLQRARAGYYGHMTHIDHQINRFVESLQMYGVHENTTICFVADHGEMMGDHHLFRKGFPYEGSSHVPLILSGPPGSDIQAGGIYDPVIELRDIMPTLLARAGLPVPESIEGRNFLPYAQGQNSTWREYLHGEHTLWGQSLHWITDGHEKYVWLSGSGREQLFDLDTDSQECLDLAQIPKYAGRVKHWRHILIQELTGREEGYTDGQRLIPGRPVKPVLSYIIS